MDADKKKIENPIEDENDLLGKINADSYVGRSERNYDDLAKNLGDTATRPFNDEATQGVRKIKDWSNLVFDTSLSGDVNGASHVRDFLLNEDHTRVGSIIKGYTLADDSAKAGTFVNQYADSKLSRMDALQKADSQIDKYLTSRNIILNGTSRETMQKAVRTGKLGGMTLTSNDREVLQEKIRIGEEKGYERRHQQAGLHPVHRVDTAIEKSVENTEAGQGANKVKRVRKFAVNTARLNTAIVTGGSVVGGKLEHGLVMQRNASAARKINKIDEKLKFSSNPTNVEKLKKDRLRLQKRSRERELKLKKKTESRKVKIGKRKQRLDTLTNISNKSTLGLTTSAALKAGKYVVGKPAKAVGKVVVSGAKKVNKRYQVYHIKRLMQTKEGRAKLLAESAKRRTRRMNKDARHKSWINFKGRVSGRLKKVSNIINAPIQALRLVKKQMIKLALIFIAFALLLVIVGQVIIMGVNAVESTISALMPDDSSTTEETMSIGQQSIEALWNRMMAYEEMMVYGYSSQYSSYSYGLDTPPVYNATINGVPIDGFSGDIHDYVGQYVYSGSCTVEEEHVSYDGETPPDYTPPTVKDAATRENVVVTFHSNIPRNDEKVDVTYYYGIKGQKLYCTSFSREGYYLAGWTRTKDSVESDYKPYNNVTDGFIHKRQPSIDLYAVWKPVETETVPVTYTSSTVGDISLVGDDEISGDLKDRFSQNAVEINIAYIDENGQTQYITEDGTSGTYSATTFFKAIMSMAAVATENEDVSYDVFYAYCEKIFDMAIGSFRGYSVDYSIVNLDGTANTDYAYTWVGDDGHTYSADGARYVAKATLYVNSDIEYLMAHDDTTASWFTDNYGIENEFAGWNEDNREWVMTFFTQTDDEWVDLYQVSFPGNVAGTLEDLDVENYLAEIEENYGGTLSYNRENLLRAAISEVGKHYYLYGGGHSPQGGAGFDCSGFVCYVLYTSGVDIEYNYRSCVALKNSYLSSSQEARIPGDLLVKNDAAGGTSSSTNHVAIYLGRLTIDGVTDEYTVECTTTNKGTAQEISGVQFRKYSGRANYKYVRAIPE